MENNNQELKEEALKAVSGGEALRTKFLCPKCNKVLYSLDALASHMESNHPSIPNP